MKLYFARGTCALAPMIVAAWTGVDLQTEAVNLGNPGPEYLRINPMGAVPALRLEDGRVMTQVEAIITYLSDLNPEAGLGGNDILESFELNQWNAFLGSDFHPAFKGVFGPARLITDANDEEIHRIKAAAFNQIDKVASILDAKIGSGNHVVLNRRSTADAHAFAMARWIRKFPDGLNAYPSLNRFMSVMEADANVQAALALEAR